MTFNDIFKSDFLSNVTSTSIIDILLGIVVSFVIGLFIFMVYKKTFTGVLYSRSFNISLIFITMATALIIMGVTSNVVLSLGMVGALSIVRFRTAIKDPMDTVFLFWSVATGILCGAGLLPMAIIGAIVIGIVLLVLVNKIQMENPYLLIIKTNNGNAESEAEQIISKNIKRYTVKSKSVDKEKLSEIIYEVRLTNNYTGFINQITAIHGIQSAVILSYDGNFAA